MGEWSRTRWPRRAGVLLAVCALALLAQRAGIAGSRLDHGLWGALESRLDLAAPVLFVMTSFVVARRSVDSAGSTWTGVRTVTAIYLAWVMTCAFAITALHVHASRSRLAVTILFFRTSGRPLPGLSAGPVLLSAVLIIAIVPVLVAWTHHGRHRQRLAGVLVALVAVAFSYRAVIVASGHVGLFGPLSWLPNQLDLVAAGLAVALVDLRALALRAHRVFAGIAVATFVLAAFALRLPRSPILTSAIDVHVFAIAALVFGFASVAAVATAPWRTRGRSRALDALVIAAPGLLLAGDAAFTLVARQYHERVIEIDGGVFLVGRILPAFIWAVCIAVAFSVTVVAVVAAMGNLRHWRTVHRSSVALPAIVAAGFFVRVITLLTVAPERTDGGDPLFYHTTANVLARGRGFPEPLNWIAYEAHRPSAFHGPLYPVVLSISSRFGGTGYFDHKMLSILIGTAVVLAVGILGRRVGGPVVGLVAAAFAAIYPNLWVIDSLLYPEGLMALAVTLTMIAAYRWRDRPRWTIAAVFGAMIALTALTRGEGILLLPLLAVPWILSTRSLTVRERLRQLAVCIVACAVVLAPWMIRNATTFAKFVPLSTNGNEVMVYANCDTAYHGAFAGYWDYQCQQKVREAQGDPPGDESQTALYWRSLGINYAKAHKSELPRVVTLRVLRQWELFRPVQNVTLGSIEGRNRDAGTMGLLMYYGLAALSLVGVVSMRRRRQAMLPLVVQFVTVTITAAYTYATVRFRVPAEPALCVLGGVGAVLVVARVRRWLARRGDAVETPSFVLGGTGGLRPRLAGMWHRAALLTWLAIGALLAVIALPLRGLYHTTGGTMEEAFMMVFPERMMKGDLPNRDFLHLYGPGSLDVLVGWYHLFGVTLQAERTFGLLQHLAIIFALFTLARPWGRAAAVATAAVAVFYVLTPIGLTAMAWNGGLALALWSVVFALRAPRAVHPRRNLIASGVLAGLALTYRPDLAPALVLVFLWYLWRNDRWRLVVPAAVAGLIPMWVHIALVGPSTAFRGMVTEPVLRLRPGRALPRPPSWSHLDGSLQAIAELLPPWWKLPALSAPKELFVWFFAMLIAPLAVLSVGTRLWRRTRSDRSAVLLAGGLLALGIVPQALQRPDSTHLSWVTCISFPLLIVTVMEWLREERPGTTARQRVAAGTAAVVALTLVVAPLFTFRYYLLHVRVGAGNIQTPFPVERNGRRFYLGDYGPYLATEAAMADLDRLSKPGDRLLVGPSDLRRTWYSDAFFYYLYPELPPATYFIEMDPGLANAPGSRLAADVASADWVVLTGFWNGWREPNTSMDYGSDAPNQVLRDHFCVVNSYQDELVTLYHRCRP